MFDIILLLSMLLLSVSIGLSLYRVMKSKSLVDRVLGMDTMSYSLVGLAIILSVMLRTRVLIEFALLIGILAFLSTIAICKFIERGVVIEHRRDH